MNETGRVLLLEYMGTDNWTVTRFHNEDDLVQHIQTETVTTPFIIAFEARLVIPSLSHVGEKP